MSRSLMSITQLCNDSQDKEQHSSNMTDPEVRLAAEALGSLANTNKMPPIILPPISTISAPSTTPSSPGLTTPRQSFSSDTIPFEDDSNESSQPYFYHRVSNHPLLHSAMRVYESSKASSPVVKYGAEMVESIASYGKFGRQQTEIQEDDPTTAATTALANASLCDHRRPVLSRDDSSQPKKSFRSTPYTLAPRPASRWKQLVVHAGSAAGTTAAVISEESMKCLKYCLSWLQYATQHIEQQMHLLRNLLVSIASQSSTTVTTLHPSSTLGQIKKEVIETLRKVVDVISKYAGSGLPAQAKASVRAFILALPSRWALLNSSASPLSSPTLGPSPQLQETSIKLLNFGCESVEMLQSVTTVFADTADRADLWLDRLHSVGVTSRQSSNNTESPVEPMETI